MYPPGDRGARVHYAVPGIRPGTGRYFHRVAAAIARGKHPVPSRTRKLSPSAPMVLRGRPRGRVGHRRTFLSEKRALRGRLLCVVSPSALYPQETCGVGLGRGGRFLATLLRKVARESPHGRPPLPSRESPTQKPNSNRPP